VIGELFAGFIEYFGGALAAWTVDRVWSPSPSIKIDFQAEQRCPNGKVTDIRRFFADNHTPLTNGADQLTICDSEALITMRSQAPRDLAQKYPGCLSWVSRELIMLRASDAVCALPGEAGYVCDGANGRVPPGARAMGIGKPVAVCSLDRLRQFGFAS